MATKTQVTRALAKVGGTLDEVGDGVYVIDSPVGMLWHTGTHTIIADLATTYDRMTALWDDLLDDIRQGVYPCNGWQDELESEGPCERCDYDNGTDRRGEWDRARFAN